MKEETQKLLRIERRRMQQLKTLTLTSRKTNAIPIRHFVLVDTHRFSTSLGTSIEFRSTTDSHTSIHYWIF